MKTGLPRRSSERFSSRCPSSPAPLAWLRRGSLRSLRTKTGRASSVKLELGLSNTIPNREGACKASIPASKPYSRRVGSSNGWKTRPRMRPIIGDSETVVSNVWTIPPRHPARLAPPLRGVTFRACHPSGHLPRQATRQRFALSCVLLLPHPPRQRSCHGGCFPRAPHLSRDVLLSSLRSGTSRASCSVVGDVERPRHGDALPHPRRFAARPIPDADARLRACHAACLSSKTRTATRHANPSGSSHAQP